MLLDYISLRDVSTPFTSPLSTWALVETLKKTRYSADLLFSCMTSALPNWRGCNYAVVVLCKHSFAEKRNTHSINEEHTHKHINIQAFLISKPVSKVKITFSFHLRRHSRLVKWERAYLKVCYISTSQLCVSQVEYWVFYLPLILAGSYIEWHTVRDLCCLERYAFSSWAVLVFNRDVHS